MDEFYVFLGMMTITGSIMLVIAIYELIKQKVLK